MNLGVLQFFSWPERRVDLATVYDRALQRIEIMDRSGYDAVRLAEHHFSSFSVCPSVHMMGTLAAARTRRLRIGTAVSLAAFYHPLRLAEELAEKRRYYEQALVAGGFSPAGRDIPMARFVGLADTDAKAEAVARRGAGWLAASYVGPRHNAVVQEARVYPGGDLVKHYTGQVILRGSPDRVVDQVLALRESAGLDYLLCAPLSHESFVMLTEQVLPRLG